MEQTSFFWFRRDLRLEDNTALFEALKGNKKVIPVFIFDESILDELEKDDARISFIYSSLESINTKLLSHGSSILCLKGNPLNVWSSLSNEFNIDKVYLNKDYEPYAIKRDQEVKEVLERKGVQVLKFKDQVIFEENEIIKNDGLPYTIYTPYKNKWLKEYKRTPLMPEITFANFYKKDFPFPSLEQLGFVVSSIVVKGYDISVADDYEKTRDFPALDSTSYLSPHLRFGTISVRQVISKLKKSNQVFVSELIWREFFMQIMYHFPKVVSNNFRSKYDGIQWRDDESDFEKWCLGKTGYPMVDAGMRQLNKTGYMHNRVRMITAGFLCKHLLIDWKWGEAYFASKLLDYELSSNNGNWQWAAGTGCDAAPYFRIFNPSAQLKKFDKNLNYVKRLIPEYGTNEYPEPIVEHTLARERCLAVYKSGIN